MSELSPRIVQPGLAVPPENVRRLLEGWHRAECWVAVGAFGFIAGMLILDVLGREFLGPVLRLLGFEPGATGIFFSQKLSIFALVIGSFAGIGIATCDRRTHRARLRLRLGAAADGNLLSIVLPIC